VNDNLVDILLVEDNSTDAALSMRVLKKFAAAERIHLARDGAEALDFLKTGGRPPHLILLDLKLPKVDGLEVLRRMKTDPDLCSLPVVIFTSSNQPKDVRDCYRLGANSYIVKPVDYERFTQAVQYIVSYWLSLNHPPEA